MSEIVVQVYDLSTGNLYKTFEPARPSLAMRLARILNANSSNIFAVVRDTEDNSILLDVSK